MCVFVRVRLCGFVLGMYWHLRDFRRRIRKSCFTSLAFVVFCVRVYVCEFERVSLPLFTCHIFASIASELICVTMKLHRLTDHLPALAAG